MYAKETRQAIILARECLVVMEAFADGKEIQYRCRKANNTILDAWTDCRDPAWNWEKFQFRIKPYPRELYTVEYVNGKLAPFHFGSLDGLKLHLKANNIRDHKRIVKFTEVMVEEGD